MKLIKPLIKSNKKNIQTLVLIIAEKKKKNIIAMLQTNYDVYILEQCNNYPTDPSDPTSHLSGSDKNNEPSKR